MNRPPIAPEHLVRSQLPGAWQPTERSTAIRPILFSAPMVRAILDGRKTQTRRIVKPQPVVSENEVAVLSEAWASGFVCVKCPFGRRGDRLWVRETWAGLYGYDSAPPRDMPEGEPIWYAANGKCPWLAAGKTRPGIFLPRWASRITLDITGVRVERLQEISKADAIAEGIQVLPLQSEDDPSAWFQSSPGVHQERTAQASFRSLWRSLNGSDSWVENPWVWVINFQRAQDAQGGANV